MKREKLRTFYHQNQVKLRPARTNFYPHGKNLALLEAKRMEFAMDLGTYIAEGVPCIYFDETSMNQGNAQKRAWYVPYEKFNVPVKAHVKNFTIYGAVGECLKNKNSYFEIHDSTNTVDIKNYMRNLAN